MVVEDMVKRLNLTNTKSVAAGSKNCPEKNFWFCHRKSGHSLPTFFGWVQDKIAKGAKNSPANGILYLKGGDYTEELKNSGLHPAKIWNLGEFLPEAELGEKFLIHFKI